MIFYTAALPNRQCQRILNAVFPDHRYMLSPACVSSFGKKREPLLYQKGYALDNGAYSYYTKGIPFDEDAFIKLLDEYAEKSDWIVIPDVVGDWQATQISTMLWLNRLAPYNRPLMIVAQDGCEERDWATLKGFLSFPLSAGIFVGGTTEWKMHNIKQIVKICHDHNKLCHVGRVNSALRVRICDHFNVDSFDGSGMSRFNRTAYIVASEMKNITNQIKMFK